MNLPEARWRSGKKDLGPVKGTPVVELDDYDDPEYEPNCMTCGGEGIAECDGDCPESDDCGCPYADGHFIRCPNCRGSGNAKDQCYW